MYFCLDTKVPKNQDLYRNSLENRPSLLKFRNSLRSNSRNFFTQERSVSTLRGGNFSNGRGTKTRNGEDTEFTLLVTSRSFGPSGNSRSEGWKIAGLR